MMNFIFMLRLYVNWMSIYIFPITSVVEASRDGFFFFLRSHGKDIALEGNERKAELGHRRAKSGNNVCNAIASLSPLIHVKATAFRGMPRFMLVANLLFLPECHQILLLFY